MTAQIDLNADLGEGGRFDGALMGVITSCNIACGGHAGDVATMRAALCVAKENHVAAGAHPSFPDRETFGRAPSTLSGSALEEVLATQIQALRDEADQLGITLAHVKPHGALYHMAEGDAGVSDSILNVLQTTLPQAKLFGPPGSHLEACARARGVGFVPEGFADRAYEANGRLRARGKPGAVIQDRDAQAKQALDLAQAGCVTAYDGTTLPLTIRTICVHGDGADAFASALAVRKALEDRGLELCAPA
ncbi:MAG: 5-oxoprolinase subunit PxpA [Pseudomonadota bacterium]